MHPFPTVPQWVWLSRTCASNNTTAVTSVWHHYRINRPLAVWLSQTAVACADTISIAKRDERLRRAIVQQSHALLQGHRFVEYHCMTLTLHHFTVIASNSSVQSSTVASLKNAGTSILMRLGLARIANATEQTRVLSTVCFTGCTCISIKLHHWVAWFL